MAKQTPPPRARLPDCDGAEPARRGATWQHRYRAHHPEPTRRDFLYIATGAAAAVGTVFTAWPLVDQMNPDAAALALATTEVDISTVQPGMSLTVKWRGKPVFIRNRTPEEIEAAKAVPVAELPDRWRATTIRRPTRPPTTPTVPRPVARTG